MREENIVIKGDAIYEQTQGLQIESDRVVTTLKVVGPKFSPTVWEYVKRRWHELVSELSDLPEGEEGEERDANS